MDFALLKVVHVTCVAVSGAGFALRGALALADAPVMRQPWVRVLPHILDTLLLVSGAWMAWIAHLAPTRHPWLAAKIALLALYIVLGAVSLRQRKSRGVRVAAYVGALLTFAWIVGVALTRNPMPIAGHWR